jgi:hypothetical protein
VFGGLHLVSSDVRAPVILGGVLAKIAQAEAADFGSVKKVS